jgi:hypothetical protein
MLKKYLVIFLFPILSCTKVLDISPQYETPQPIGNAIFTTTHQIDFYMAESNSILDTGIVWISDAQVELYEDGVYKENLYHLQNEAGHYISALYPVPDKTYEIKAKNQKYEISASNIIPEPGQLLSYKYTIPAGFNLDGSPYYEAEIKFKDNAETSDYYEISIYNKFDANLKGYIKSFNTNDQVIVNEGDMDYNPETLFFSDELFNGQTYKLKFKFNEGYAPSGNGHYQESVSTYMAFRSVSKEYYLYRKSWTRHRYFQNNVDQGIYTLFKGDPVEMYTNINNGYGIFAGYNQQDVKLVFVPQK